MRFVMTIGTVVLLAVFALMACETQAPQTMNQSMIVYSKLDGLLQIWLEEQQTHSASEFKAYDWDLDGQGRIGVLIGLQPNAKMPALEGMQVLLQRGQIVTAYASAEALRRLASHPAISRLEASVRLYSDRDLSNGDILTHKDTIDPTKPITYTFSPSKLALKTTAKVTFRVDTAYDSKLRIPECLPILSLCSDSACTNVVDKDTATFKHTPPSGTTLTDKPNTPLSHVILSHSFSKPTDKLFFKVEAYLHNQQRTDCRVNIMVSSHDVVLQPSDLSGGNISATSKVRLMGNGLSLIRKQKQINGKGVIVGVIDSGIDWCHQDFIDANGKTRILALWDQYLTATGAEKALDVGDDKDPSNDLGVLYPQADIDAALKNCDTSKVRSRDTSGHGSHVAGIAAASGPLPGVAPEADILFVKFRFTTLHVPAAVDFMINEAKKRKKPLVMNMSFSTEIGPKDGTSLRERVVTNAIGPGRNIVASAGNNGSLLIHAKGVVPLQKTVELKFTYPKNNTGQLLYLYTHPDDVYELTLKSPFLDQNKKNIEYKGNWGQYKDWTQNLDSSLRRIYLTGGSLLDKRIESVFGVYFNGKSPGQNWVLSVKRVGGPANGGAFDAYVSKRQTSYARFTSNTVKNKDGSYQGTLGAPGSSPGALTVGSYQLRYAFDIRNNTWRFFTSYQEFGHLASSSSSGPSGDGRPGVDIVAPGRYIVSTESRHRTKSSTTLANQNYRAISGTSMSTPMVAGISALLLQQDPSLFVRPLLKKHARKPIDIANPDPNRWGSGMVQMHGVFEALAKSKAPTITLETKDGSLVKKAPYTVELVVKTSDKISEFHWDTNGDGFTDEITTTPTFTTKTTPFGNSTLGVTAFNEEGKSTSAKIVLTSTTPTPQVHLQEINVGNKDYIALKNSGTTDINLQGYVLFANDKDPKYKDFKYTIGAVVIKAGQTLYFMESKNCPSQGSSNCINTNQSISYSPGRSGNTYLCWGTCSNTTVIDFHTYNSYNLSRQIISYFGTKFLPKPSTGVTSSTQDTRSFVRQKVTGSYPIFQESDWKADSKTLCSSDERLCNGICQNIQTNRSHCGGCGKACSTGEVCSKGACAGLEPNPEPVVEPKPEPNSEASPEATTGEPSMDGSVADGSSSESNPEPIVEEPSASEMKPESNSEPTPELEEPTVDEPVVKESSGEEAKPEPGPEPQPEPKPEPVAEKPASSEPIKDASTSKEGTNQDRSVVDKSSSIDGPGIGPPESPDGSGCNCSVTSSSNAPFDSGMLLVLLGAFVLLRRQNQRTHG